MAMLPSTCFLNDVLSMCEPATGSWTAGANCPSSQASSASLREIQPGAWNREKHSPSTAAGWTEGEIRETGKEDRVEGDDWEDPCEFLLSPERWGSEKAPNERPADSDRGWESTLLLWLG